MKSGYQILEFFSGTFVIFFALQIFSTKGIRMGKKNKYEIFSPILVVFQMRSVCTAVKKDVALM